MIKSYDIKRGDAVIATVKPQGYISEQIMGESGVTMSFELSSFVDFHTSDTVRIDTVDYVLNTEPSVNKISRKRFQYQLNFQGFKFELDKTAFLSLGDDNTLKEVDFSVMGNATVFIDLIIANMNREHSGWVRGTVDDTDFKNLTFSEQNCLSALADLATEFNTEYWITGKTIHLTKKGNISGLNFEYGRGNGLYRLGRSQPSDKKIFTRIIARGGTKNIPGSYRGSSTRLQMPAGINYLERNVAKYGVIEVSRTYDEIFPRREGIVTTVDDEFTFSDSGIDFDINAQQIPGSDSKGKITFNTGQLAGFEFDIFSYDHATKTIKISVNKDEKAIAVPSALVHAAVGDKFVVTDIIMPDTYIIAGELEVQAKAQADLNQNSDPWAAYNLEPDALDFKRKNIVLTLGDYVHLADTDLGIDDDIRVISYKKDLQDYYKYTEIALATVVAISSIVRQFAQLEKTQKAVQFNRLTDAARSRRNYKTTEELKNLVFDPDGYFTDKIRPLSIETTMISVAAKSQQFVLNGIIFSPNFEASQAKIRTTAGSLDHFSLTDTIRSWNIALYSNDGLVAGTAYYIYAKCEKAGIEGALLLSTAKITVAQDVDYYHFLIGVLHSPIDGVRGISLTYGQTTINGKFVTTGVITSTNGLTYFNLDTGEISGKITFGAGSSGYSSLTDKPDLSGLALTTYVDAIKADLQNQIDGQITSWFFAYVPTLSNAPYTDWSTDTIRDNHLGDLFYNTATGYAYRFMKVSSVYSWSRISDTDVVTALANAAAAQDTADHKRRVFVTTPTVPYDVGDLWSQGTGGELMRCNTAKTAAQTYSSADWGKASKYTDDTAATALQSALGALAYENLIGTAKLDSTVIDGGYIKSTLLNVSAIVVAGGLETTSGAQTKANAAQSAATSAAATDATSKANAAQAAAIASAAASLSSLSGSLGAMAYESLVSAAKLDSTVIVGGYIKSSLLDVSAIIVNGSISTTTDAQSRANAAQAAAISAASSDATTKANAAQSAAQTYAAAQAAYEREVAKAHADGIVDTEEARAIADAAAKLVEAKADATTKADAAQAAAATDATTKANAAQATAISTAAADATTKANAAQSAAQTYAAAQAAYEREVAKAHADGIVDTEEARAIADAAAKLVEAKADATTKADAAQAAAEAYAASADSALSASLGSLAYQSLVAASMLDSTIIVGGYIKTTLLDVDFIKGLDFDFVSGTVGGFDINSEKLVSDKVNGLIEMGSGDDPYISMTYYYYPSPGVKLSTFGVEITPLGIDTQGLKVRSGGIIVDTDKPGISGSFQDIQGSTVTVVDGIITAIV